MAKQVNQVTETGFYDEDFWTTEAGYAEIDRTIEDVIAKEAAQHALVAEALAGLSSDGLSDDQLAKAMLKLYGDELKYCPTFKKNGWLHYENGRWQNESQATPFELLRELVQYLQMKAITLTDKGRKEELLLETLKIEMSRRQENVIRAAQRMRAFEVFPREFDVDPWLLNVQNGTIDLRNGTLRPHNPDDRLTKQIPVLYHEDDVPEQACQTWLKFLADVFVDNPELIPFVQMAIGYTLTGIIEEEKFFIPFGSGGNGKTKFMNGLRGVFGMIGDVASPSSYVQNTSIDLLLRKDSHKNQVMLAHLFGARLVTAVEPNARDVISESMVKTLTGTDTITAKRLYEDPFDYRPTYKIWLLANHKPRVLDMSDAFWDRPVPIPFLQKFRGTDKQDIHLEQKIYAELPGILRWAVIGCLKWQEQGKLILPDCVLAAREAYKEENDTLGDFIDEYYVRDPEGEAGVRELEGLYKKHCEMTGEARFPNHKLHSMLAERKIPKLPRKTTGMYFGGIRRREERDVEEIEETPLGAPADKLW
jgi:putative DNA primase/helicase